MVMNTSTFVLSTLTETISFVHNIDLINDDCSKLVLCFYFLGLGMPSILLVTFLFDVHKHFDIFIF